MFRFPKICFSQTLSSTLAISFGQQLWTGRGCSLEMMGNETLPLWRLTGNWAKGQNERVPGERRLTKRVVKPGSPGWERVAWHVQGPVRRLRGLNGCPGWQYPIKEAASQHRQSSRHSQWSNRKAAMIPNVFPARGQTLSSHKHPRPCPPDCFLCHYLVLQLCGSRSSLVRFTNHIAQSPPVTVQARKKY